jgi:hypothetical protein
MNPPDQPTTSDTPRTDAAYFANGATMYSLAGEMKLLERELAAAKAECDLNRNRLASILWSGAIDKQLCGDVQKWADDYTAELTRLRAELAIAENWVEHHSQHADDLIGENVRLRAEVERRNDIINRASVQFFHDGTDGETAAKMLTVLNEAKP